MRPRPLSTRTYLKEVSEALRKQQQPKVPLLKQMSASAWGTHIGFIVFLGLLLWLSLLPSRLPKPELIDSTTHFREAAGDFVVGQWYDEILPDGKGTHVRARYMGKLAPGQVLKHADLGDEYAYQGNYWIWMIPAGKTAPEWVDP